MRSFYREVLRRVGSLPGVAKVGGSNGIPLSGSGGSGTTTIDNPAFLDDRGTPEADQRIVTPGYFEAMGMTLLSGRLFDERDSETGQPVAIIDETMARTFWANEDPLGKRIKRGGRQGTQPWLTIVGVVRHVRNRTLEEPSRVQLYMPHAQVPTTGMSLAVKANVDPRTLTTAIQREVLAVDREQPVWAIRTMDELMATSVMRRQLIMTLLSLFAGIALTLAAVGIYGVISYWVTQRSHEIGIRVAIGASRLDVLKMVLGQSMSIVLIGVAIGLAGAVALTRVMGTPALQRLDDRHRDVWRLLSGVDSRRAVFELPAGETGDAHRPGGDAAAAITRQQRVSTPNHQLPTTNPTGLMRSLGTGNWELGAPRFSADCHWPSRCVRDGRSRRTGPGRADRCRRVPA